MDKDTSIQFSAKCFKGVYNNYSSAVYRLVNDLDLVLYIGNSLVNEYQDAFVKIAVEVLTLYEKVVPCIKLMIDVCGIQPHAQRLT